MIFMASATTSPAILPAGLLQTNTVDLISEQGAACHLPPEVVTSARRLHGQVINPAIFSRGEKSLMAAACLCVAARYAHRLFSFNDLARAAFTDRAAINHMAMRLQKVLGLRRPPADLRLLVPQICEQLALPADTQDAAYQIALRLHAHLPSSLQGRLPSAVAAAIVCAAGDTTLHAITYTASARAAHVAISATIRARKTLAQLPLGAQVSSP